MEKELLKMAESLEEKIVTLSKAIQEADAVSEEYTKLLTAFNSSMVVYSEIKSMFLRAAQAAKEQEKEGEKENGTNN